MDMKYFKLAFLLVLITAFIAVITGAHHQIAIMIMSAIMYIVLTTETTSNERSND